MGKACLLIFLMAICVIMSGCCCLSTTGDSDSPDSSYSGDYGPDDSYSPDDLYGGDLSDPPEADDSGIGEYDATPLPTKSASAKPATSTPAPTKAPASTPTYVDYNNHVVTQSELTASNNSIKKTAEAILAHDKTAFLQYMSKETLQQVSGEPDLTSPQSAKLANGLKTARLIQAEPYMMTYQMTIDSTTYTFNTIKEDGTWKLTGL